MNTIAKRIVKLARELERIKTGYDQNAKGRWSVFDFIRKLLRPNKATDCSAGAAGVAYLAGVPWNLKINTWTGNFAAQAKATGLYTVERFKSLKQALPGGFLLTPGRHVVVVLDKGEVLSPELNERGGKLGGKPGDQTGREVKIRKLYVRPGGWTYVINLIPVLTHKLRTIVAFGKTGSGEPHLSRLEIVAPYDGPAYRAFLKAWAILNKGMTLQFTATPIGVTGHHAFVVLGTKLNADGSLTKKFQRRLQLALEAAQANPASLVVVSGGKPYSGVTEGKAGRDWLVKNGIDASRVYTEDSSTSTVGNAKYTVPLLKKLSVTGYTLISDASHLRRASVDFLAAALKIQTATNKSVDLVPTVPLAVNDYGSGPVKTQGPVSDADRATMAAEVISVLDL